MTDYRVLHEVVEDDKSDGCFWRQGEPWSRENGKETPLKELAPHLTKKMMMELDFDENYASSADCRKIARKLSSLVVTGDNMERG